MLQCFRNYSILYIYISISHYYIAHDPAWYSGYPCKHPEYHAVARMCSVSQVYSGATVVMWRLPRGKGRGVKVVSGWRSNCRWRNQWFMGQTSEVNKKHPKQNIKKTYVEDILYIYITHRTTVIHEYPHSEIWNPWIPWVNVPIRIPSSDPRCCIDKDAESVWCAHVEYPVETSGVRCRSWYLQDMHTVYTWIIGVYSRSH